MQTQIHTAQQRGVAEHGWLHSRFSFSFSHYYNPNRMGFGALRVINDDIIEANGGFKTHPHQNMEIITIVLEGALEHKDSFGNSGVIYAGEIQYMSAGKGVYHSEFNPQPSNDTSLFQIWIEPNVKGTQPQYDQRDFRKQMVANAWVSLVDNSEAEAISIKQNARILMANITQSKRLALPEIALGHGALLLVIEGSVTVDGEPLHRRDEMQLHYDATQSIAIEARSDASVLLFDVPM